MTCPTLTASAPGASIRVSCFLVNGHTALLPSFDGSSTAVIGHAAKTVCGWLHVVTVATGAESPLPRRIALADAMDAAAQGQPAGSGVVRGGFLLTPQGWPLPKGDH